MKNKNKKGFTLIELLAVIVILGIILVIAIPSISAAILNSRKNAYVTTANEFVDGLRMMTLTDASLLPTDGSRECKALTAIKLEKGSNTKSPFGKKYTENSRVCVKYDGDKKSYTYSVCLVDEGGNGLSSTDVLNLSKSDVKTGNFYCNLDGTGGDGNTIPEEEMNIGREQVVASRYAHTLALLENGSVYAWGLNDYGQLGNGNNTSYNGPVKVQGLTDVIQISGGSHHSIALKEDGTVWTWGKNNNGQLGDGTTINSSTPIQIPGLTDVKQVEAGADFSMAMKKDGTVWAWGDNSSGQLGDGTFEKRTTPVNITALNGLNIKKIFCGSAYTIALLNNGTIRTWGVVLGNGTTQNSNIPVENTNITNVKQVATGFAHSIIIKEDGTVWAWGKNNYGQLGDGTTKDRSLPVQILKSTSVKEVVAAYTHSMAILTDGTVLAWGKNEQQQLGDGTQINRTLPVTVTQLANLNVKQLTGGSEYTVALLENRVVKSWGLYTHGRLGGGTILLENLE